MSKQQWFDLADILARFHVLATLMMLGYGAFVWEVFAWIKSLDEVGVEAAGIFATVTGVSAAVFSSFIGLVKAGRLEDG